MTRNPSISTSLFCTLLLACLLPVPVCQAASSIKTLNGITYTGKIDLDNNGLTITPEQGTPVKVDLANVWSAVFNQPTGSLADSWPQGVFLTNGSFIGGQVKLSTEGVVIGSGSNAPVPATNVAWVLSGPMKFDKFPHPAKGHTGVILPNGDFFEGIYNGINDEHRIMINSWMFGPHNFGLNPREIAAAVIRDIPDVESLNEIVMTNGSRYHADDLKIDPQNVVFHDSILGEMRAKNGEILEIRAGRKRYQFLAGLKPVSVEVSAGVDANAAVKAQPGEGTGTDIPASLLTLANAAVSYAIPAGFTIFSADIAIPKDALPDTRLTFAVYSDGRFLLMRSPIIALGDKPQSLHVDLGNNVRTLVIRAEPAAPGSGKSAGKWIAPMFVRP